MSELNNKINELRTLKKSYSDLADKYEVIASKTEEMKDVVINNIPNLLMEALDRRYTFPVSYDGATISDDSIKITSILSSILYSSYITELVDDSITNLSTKLKSLRLDHLKKITLNRATALCNQAFANTALTHISCPALEKLGWQTFRELGNLVYANIPKCKIGDSTFILSLKLIDIICGENFNSNITALESWEPTEAMREDDNSLVSDSQDETGNPIDNNRKQLLYNIRRHIAANMPTTSAGYTIKFSSGLKDIIAADENTIKSFTDKGWVIS